MFAVPLIQVRHEDAARLGEALAAVFYDKERQGDQYRNEKIFDTQHGGLFESRFDLFTWPEAPVRELASFCHTSVASTVARLNDYDEAEMQELSFDYHAWFHITRKGGYQALHNHPNASWSGIYCVDPGEVVEGRQESGAVRFRNPYQNAGMYADAGIARVVDPYGTGGVQIQHECGKLVIFPSSLEHEVFPYQGERPRIVVAFNCWIKRLRRP